MCEVGMPTLRVRMNFCVPHLLAATKFSIETFEIEKQHKGEKFSGFWQDILSNSSACVLECVAGLESYINELFADHKTLLPGIDEELLQKILELTEYKPILEKYDIALLIKNKTKIPKGESEYQNVDALICLRNAITHFKPEWDDEQKRHDKISKVLRGKFLPSVFLDKKEPLFPKKWASSGCTKWAIKSTVDYIKKFNDIGLFENKINQFIDRFDYK